MTCFKVCNRRQHSATVGGVASSVLVSIDGRASVRPKRQV